MGLVKRIDIRASLYASSSGGFAMNFLRSNLCGAGGGFARASSMEYPRIEQPRRGKFAEDKVPIVKAILRSIARNRMFFCVDVYVSSQVQQGARTVDFRARKILL